jgi:predicted NAD-dependent protein-ADP-ribosyltransferase YbiA (DUF1768 family)
MWSNSIEANEFRGRVGRVIERIRDISSSFSEHTSARVRNIIYEILNEYDRSDGTGSELITWALTDREFAQWLNETPSTTGITGSGTKAATIWQQLLNAISSIFNFGVKENYLLQDTINILNSALNEVPAESKPAVQDTNKIVTADDVVKSTEEKPKREPPKIPNPDFDMEEQIFIDDTPLDYSISVKDGHVSFWGEVAEKKETAAQKVTTTGKVVSKTINVWNGSKEHAAENAIFSNLSERPFIIKGVKYRSVEHAYQSWKTGTFNQAIYDAYNATNYHPGKNIDGGEAKTDNNWHIKLIKRIMKESFIQNPDIASKLVATGNAKFEHKYDKSDWATIFPTLLEQIREELRGYKGPRDKSYHVETYSSDLHKPTIPDRFTVQSNPDTLYFFTENLEAAVAAENVDVDPETVRRVFDGRPVLKVSKGVSGTNTAYLRTDEEGKPMRNTQGIIVKMYQHGKDGKSSTSSDSMFKESEFELFKHVNTTVLNNSVRFKNVTLPESIAMGKARLPNMEWAIWLAKEIRARFNVEYIVQYHPSGNGFGLEKKGLGTLNIKQVVASDKKVLAKQAVSNKFIGFGQGIPNSTTENYRLQAGRHANTGVYGPRDVIFVSIPGKRSAPGNIVAEQQERTIKEALKAIKAGAMLITDDEEYLVSDSYNTGEKMLAKRLKDLGYSYETADNNGVKYGIWFNPDHKDEDEVTESNETERPLSEVAKAILKAPDKLTENHVDLSSLKFSDDPVENSAIKARIRGLLEFRLNKAVLKRENVHPKSINQALTILDRRNDLNMLISSPETRTQELVNEYVRLSNALTNAMANLIRMNYKIEVLPRVASLSAEEAATRPKPQDEEVKSSKVAISIYEKLGDKTTVGRVKIENYSDLSKKDLSPYGPESLSTIRIAGTTNHFGNPFTSRSENAGKGLTKVPTTKDAVMAYIDWVLTDKYLNVEPARRDFIRETIKSRKYLGADIYYYSELNEPSHANALDYMINHPALVDQQGEGDVVWEFQADVANATEEAPHRRLSRLFAQKEAVENLSKLLISISGTFKVGRGIELDVDNLKSYLNNLYAYYIDDKQFDVAENLKRIIDEYDTK